MANRTQSFNVGFWSILGFTGLFLIALPVMAESPNPLAKVDIGNLAVDFELGTLREPRVGGEWPR